MRLFALVFLCFIAAGYRAHIAFAQTVRGLVVDQFSAPVTGAVVTVLDTAEQPRGGAFTEVDGRFVIKLSQAGTYRLRVERIGYATTHSQRFSVEVNATVEQRVEAPAAPVRIPAITAAAKRRCIAGAADGHAAALLWTEARKALSASELTRTELYRFRVRRYSRRLDLASLRVNRDSASERLEYADGSPFVAAPAASLIERGFIQVTDTGTYYYAPDASVLLSAEFASAYCFSPVEDGVRNRVGVSFAPVDRIGRPAVQGTLWLDATSFELREITYRYARAELPSGPVEELGGAITFERLPNERWIVSKWRIRSPEVAERVLRLDTNRTSRSQVLIGLKEDGGEVLGVASRSGEQILISANSPLHGTAYDSMAAAPLIGATVYLEGTRYSTITDEQGHYNFPELPDGNYVLRLSHPKLTVYHAPAPQKPVAIRSGEARTELLAVPGHIPESQCQSRRTNRNDDGTGIVAGWIRDGRDMPMPHTRLTLSWHVTQDSTAARTLDTDSAGAFVACWIPIGLPITLETEQNVIIESGGKTVHIPPNGFASLEIHSARPDSRGTADIVVQLRDWDSGKAIRAANVSVPGSQRRAITNADGNVKFESVPFGQHTIEIEHLAYGRFVDSITVSPQLTAFRIRVPATSLSLRALEVTATSRTTAARLVRGSRADILTRKDIEPLETRARHIGDLVRSMPALRVRELYTQPGRTLKGVCIESRRGPPPLRPGKDQCNPVLAVIDGIPINQSGSARVIDWAAQALLDFPPGAIESIEFIPATEAGARFGIGSSNGVLVIYTRGNGPYVTNK